MYKNGTFHEAIQAEFDFYHLIGNQIVSDMSTVNY